MTQSPTKYVTQIRKQEGWAGEAEAVGGRGYAPVCSAFQAADAAER